MSANQETIRGVKLARDEYHERLAARGHVMRWQLGPGATKRGHAYFWEGECQRCGATMSIASCSSSSHGPIDAREGECSGSTVLAEARQALFRADLADALAEYGQAVYEGHEAAELAAYAEEMGWDGR